MAVPGISQGSPREMLLCSNGFAIISQGRRRVIPPPAATDEKI